LHIFIKTRISSLSLSISLSGWEPADKWKGVLARTYLYISTAYRNVFTCCDVDGVDGAIIKPWLLKTLLAWHTQFKVSQYEIDRNELIYSKLQHNRNPFIDNGDWAFAIW
jgi:endonuclease I